MSELVKILNEAQTAVVRKAPNTLVARRQRWAGNLTPESLKLLSKTLTAVKNVFGTASLPEPGTPMEVDQKRDVTVEFTTLRDAQIAIEARMGVLKEAANQAIDDDLRAAGVKVPEAEKGDLAVDDLPVSFVRQGGGWNSPTYNLASQKALFGDDWEKVIDRATVTTVTETVNEDKIMDYILQLPKREQKKFIKALTATMEPATPKPTRMVVQEVSKGK